MFSCFELKMVLYYCSIFDLLIEFYTIGGYRYELGPVCFPSKTDIAGTFCYIALEEVRLCHFTGDVSLPFRYYGVLF